MPKLAQIFEQSCGTRQVCVSVFFLFWSFYKTNRFHVAMGLFSNRSQRTSKCGKNISDTLACGSCATSLFLRHFDVICDLLLNRPTATGKELYSTICLSSCGCINGYQWHAALGGGVTLQWTSIPSGGVAILLGMPHVKETRISSGRMGLWLVCTFAY